MVSWRVAIAWGFVLLMLLAIGGCILFLLALHEVLAILP